MVFFSILIDFMGVEGELVSPAGFKPVVAC